MVKLLSIPLKTATALSIMAIAVLTFFTITAWLTSQWLVIITSQVVLSAMGIFSILAMGGGAFLGRLYYLKRQSELSRDRTLAHNEARQANIQSDRAQMHLAAEGRMMAAAVRQVENGLIYSSALGEGVKFSSFPASIINQVTEALPEPAQHVWPKKLNLFDLLPSGNGDLNNIILGVDNQNGIVSTSLEDMVHCAFGGETGTGKSTLAYSMAYQIATAPQDTQMILADPAGTTWKTLSDCDRLMFPIISSDSDCLHVLNELHDISTQRTEETFGPYPTVEKLSEYNAVVKPGDRLDYIAIFIDEFPEYLENKDIETILRRLIRKSRKAGIYIFGMGTSWKHSDMDTSIKRQFRTKIHFGASDAISSRVLLGTDDASKIKQVGRAYAKLPFGMSDDNKPIQFQATHIDKLEVMNRINKPTILDLPTSQTARPNMTEQAVIDAHNNGIGHKECYRIFAKLEGLKIPKTTKQVGGSQTVKIKNILLKWGVSGV